MATEFLEADEVEMIAVELIRKYHTHLVEAKIRYLFREEDWESKGKTILGKAYKLSGKEQYLADGADFAIVINRPGWTKMDFDQRKALLDHELCHCGRNGEDDDGNPRWTIWEHDVQEFRAIIDRHGLWQSDLKAFGTSVARHIRQTTLFDRLPTQDEDTAQVS